MATSAKYETDIAAKIAKKALTSAPKHNPEGTLPFDWICPYYYEKFYFKKGHDDCRLEDCHMFGKPKNKRDTVVALTMQEYIAISVDVNMTKGK